MDGSRIGVTPPRRRHRTAIFAALTCLAVLSSPAAAAQRSPGGGSARVGAADEPTFPTANQPFSACSDTDGKAYARDLPALPCLPYVGGQGGTTRWLDYGAPFGDITQYVSRAKVQLRLQPIVARSFFTICVRNTPGVNICPRGFDVRFPGDNGGDSGYFGVAADVFVQSPLGDEQTYGNFAAIKGRTLAFGSLPLSATVRVRQARRAGKVVPLRLAWFSGLGRAKGTVLPGYERYGPNPYDVGTFIPEPHIRGPISITLSDVRLDGVPVDVGASCSTSTVLDLTAAGGWVPSGDPQRGRPGAYSPVLPRSYLESNLVIPPFTGCRNGGEDLSPLATALLSSTRNPLSLTETGVLRSYGCLPASADPNTCSSRHPRTIDPRDVPGAR